MAEVNTSSQKALVIPKRDRATTKTTLSSKVQVPNVKDRKGSKNGLRKNSNMNVN